MTRTRTTNFGPEISANMRRAVLMGTACVALLATIALGQPKDGPTPALEEPAAEASKPAEGAAESPPRKQGFTPPKSLDQYFLAGGLLMYPIAFCSVIAIAYSLERLVVLRRRRVIPRDFVTRFIQQLEQGKLDRRSALKVCEDNGSPMARVFEHGILKWGKPSVEVEQAIIDGGERQVSQLRKHLRILNAVATIAPLLGLLGTVVGMIQTFYEIADSAGAAKAGDFAGGIGVALITTAAGLLVAIPALTVYMFLIGRVEALVSDMDHAAQKVVNLISAEALSAPAPAPAVRPRPPAAVKPEPPTEDPEPPPSPKERRRVMG